MQNRLSFSRAARLGALLLSTCALATCVLAPAIAATPSDVFTVGNYPVDARAADAVAAKKTAIASGQTSALRSLLKRLVPVTAYPRLRKVQLGPVDNIIDGISVRSERNSTTEYIANLDFSFRPDAVRALLERENLPYVEQQAPPITIVPVWQADTQPIPGVDAGAWQAAWAGVDVAHALTPVKLVALKPGVHPDTIAALAQGDTTLLRTFAGEYGGEERLVAAILMPQPKERKLQVTLVGRDTVGSIAWIKAYRFDTNDPGYAIELAAIVSLGVLEGRWKASGGRVQGPIRAPGAVDAPFASPSAISSEPSSAQNGDALRLAVEFRDIGEWATISKRLSQVPGVENIDVAGLSGRSARISLQFTGSMDSLAQAVADQGLRLRQGPAGWVLTGS